ncbi:MAG: hypothetical protein Q7T55_21620, partial [Solirubrobacteraceae bacterium]|nr:hypothetical protein [Solirubrobacteraceae bacterium]
GKTVEILQLGDYLIGADANIDRILFSTERKLSPADTNANDDVYVWDRPNDRYVLVSKDSQGRSLFDDAAFFPSASVISDNGNVVQFSKVEPWAGGGNEWKYEQFRHDLTTGITTKLSDEESPIGVAGIGTDGTTSVTRKAVQRGDLVTATPGQLQSSQTLISPDGGTVAWTSAPKDPDHVFGRQIEGVDATNGYGGSITVPTWLAEQGYTAFGIANGGSSVTLGTALQWGVRYAIGRIDRGGNVSQVGQDIAMTDTIMQRGIVLSRNEKFVATGLSLVKLGDLPLPGTEPNPPSEAKGFDYLRYESSKCKTSWFWRYEAEPTLRFGYNAQGSDLRRPTAATVKVYRGNGTSVTSTLKFGTNEEKTLSVGLEGNFRMEAKVTMQDGEVLSDTWTIPSHAKTTPCAYPW